MNVDHIIDYATPQGNKLYKQAVCPLCEVKYDLDEPSLTTILQVVDNCITECAWEVIFSIPETLNSAPPHNDLQMLTSNYGALPKLKLTNSLLLGLQIMTENARIHLTHTNI